MIVVEKSAEVIVVDKKRADTYGVKSEYSRVDEGLNIELRPNLGRNTDLLV